MGEKNKDVKVVAIIALVVAALGLSVAYAALSTTLNITGTATVNSASWDVEFEKSNKPVVKTGSATFKEPTYAATTLSNYAVTLTKPGDKVTYIFDIHNKGSLDAKLKTFTKSDISCVSDNPTEANATCKDLTYTISYSDGSAITNGNLLPHGQTKEVKITVEFKSSATKVPAKPVTVNGLGVTFLYEQA